MHKTEFLYWLQGFFELRNNKYPLADWQLKVISDHLNLVRGSEGKLTGYLVSLEEALKLVSMRKVDTNIMTALIEKHLQDEFKHLEVNPSKANPFLNGYEPLGDLYNNQRLC